MGTEEKFIGHQGSGPYHLHFEPGYHAMLPEEYEEIRRRFLAGDLTVHVWNSQVASRMRGYTPELLGLDGNNSPLNREIPALSWTGLPGSPREMTGRDSIYLVNGDINYLDMTDQASDPMNVGLQKTQKKVNGDFDRNFIAEQVATVAAAAALSACLLKSKAVSRRQFLRSGLGLFALGLSGKSLGSLSSAVHAYSPSGSLSEVFREVTDLTRPIVQSAWLDGRTALVLAKTIDAAHHLNLPPRTHLSVVMGFAHDYQAGSLLRNQVSRREMIRRYAEEAYQSVFPLTLEAQYLQDNAEDRQYVKDTIAAFFAITEVMRITDPGITYSPNPKDVIATSFSRVARFLSPQVRSALDGFGDPIKFFTDLTP